MPAKIKLPVSLQPPPRRGGGSARYYRTHSSPLYAGAAARVRTFPIPSLTLTRCADHPASVSTPVIPSADCFTFIELVLETPASGRSGVFEVLVSSQVAAARPTTT